MEPLVWMTPEILFMFGIVMILYAITSVLGIRNRKLETRKIHKQLIEDYQKTNTPYFYDSNGFLHWGEDEPKKPEGSDK